MVKLSKFLFLSVLNNAEDSNVIVVDWGRLAAFMYLQAVDNTVPVGTYVGQFLSLLEQNNYIDLRNIHMIGHSLGAHISGIAGAYVGGRVGRITGTRPKESPLQVLKFNIKKMILATLFDVK